MSDIVESDIKEITEITFSVTYDGEVKKVTVKVDTTITELIEACKRALNISNDESVGLYDMENMMFSNLDKRTVQVIKCTELRFV
ncbi:hypothetical protein GGH94_001239 [Coemansia aciculifera]|uniref:Ubiquitin-like domain-containing protein n=1 Tax=Coemansia aciculifera TaxID=417176 RepID=A0A9W8IN61_9FUNG|nr:hypothetical protein GGH94_001239 [Coemansia aciculifera]